MALNAETVGPWVVAVLGAGLGSKVLDMWGQRRAQMRREPADLTAAAAEFQKALTGGARELIDHLVSETVRLGGRTDELQAKADAAKHAADEARDVARALEQAHARCEAELASQRRVTARQQRQIDKLMEGPVAGYGQAPPP